MVEVNPLAEDDTGTLIAADAKVGFDDNAVAGACVSDIIKAGVLPVAIEFMDRPCIEATEAFASPKESRPFVGDVGPPDIASFRRRERASLLRLRHVIASLAEASRQEFSEPRVLRCRKLQFFWRQNERPN